MENIKKQRVNRIATISAIKIFQLTGDGSSSNFTSYMHFGNIKHVLKKRNKKNNLSDTVLGKIKYNNATTQKVETPIKNKIDIIFLFIVVSI